MTHKNHSNDILKFATYAVPNQKVSHGLSTFTEINSVLLVGGYTALNYENPTKYVCSLYLKFYTE